MQKESSNKGFASSDPQHDKATNYYSIRDRVTKSLSEGQSILAKKNKWTFEIREQGKLCSHTERSKIPKHFSYDASLKRRMLQDIRSEGYS